MDVLAAIHQRVSVRSYADRPVEPALLERLLRFGDAADHLTDVQPRLALISGTEQVQHILTFMVGSYGLVYNAPHLLVGVLQEESDEARVDLGYVLEQVVLEATRLGLGTCWITGTYDPERAANAVKLRSNEVAAAVCALGYPTEQTLGRLHTKAIRRLAGGQRRKPLTNIVFSGRWGLRWSPEDADPTLVTMLDHARLAPSARNAQPWRFVVQAEGVVLTLTRPSFVDAGIVMSHLTLASATLEHAGSWRLRLRDEALARECDLPRGVIPVATFEHFDG
ncbi:MAG: nitroreductase family protein [Anaerolineae bacterium]|jgi:nitroreductase